MRVRWVTDWSSSGQSDKFWTTGRQSTNRPNPRGVCCNYPIRFSPKHPLPKYSLYLSKSIFSYTPRKTKDINKSKYKFNIFSNKLNRTLEGEGNFFFFFFFLSFCNETIYVQSWANFLPNDLAHDSRFV